MVPGETSGDKFPELSPKPALSWDADPRQIALGFAPANSARNGSGEASTHSLVRVSSHAYLGQSGIRAGSAEAFIHSCSQTSAHLDEPKWIRRAMALMARVVSVRTRTASLSLAGSLLRRETNSLSAPPRQDLD